MKWLSINDDQSNIQNNVRSVTKSQWDGSTLRPITRIIAPSNPELDAELKTYSTRVFNNLIEVWEEIFEIEFEQFFDPPKLVFYTAHFAAGRKYRSYSPSYYHDESAIYLDMKFFIRLYEQYSVEGRFIVAYIIAHEFGHHIEKLLGYYDGLPPKMNISDLKTLRLKLELQADYYAGIWVRYAQKMNLIHLEEGDISSVISMANMIGDDKVRKGLPLTHGTSEQRMKNFMDGLNPNKSITKLNSL